jgi:hypothetical protein
MKLRSLTLLLFCPLLAGVWACRLATELMHMTSPQVVSYAPSSELMTADSLEEVRIEFSQDMDRTRTEEAFSLLEDQQCSGGCFIWEGPLLRFRPFAGFRANKTYRMSVSTAAEDRFGNSLAEEFSFRFFTGEDRIPPEITSYSPAEGEIVANLYRPIRLIFSESVDPGSLYGSFTVSPGISGAWSWNGDATEAEYIPLQGYQPGEEYRVEVGTGLMDRAENRLAERCVFRFSIQEPPQQEILLLSTSDGRMALLPVEQRLLNQGLEKDDDFRVELGAPVDPARTTGFIKVLPGVPFQCEWSDDFTVCCLHFNEPLEWEGIYELCLLESVYRLQVTNPASQPPSVKRVTFCNDTAAPAFRELMLNQNLSLSDSGSACFDFYIEHAPGFPVELGSFLEALSIDAGDCLRISLLAVVRNPLPPAPVPEPPPGSNTDVLRIYCRLEDTDNPPGIISLELEASLADTNQNFLQSPFVLTVNKL